MPLPRDRFLTRNRSLLVVGGAAGLDPLLDVGSLPYAPLGQLVVGRRPIRPLRELVHALPADAAQALPDLRRSHQDARHATSVRETSPRDGLHPFRMPSGR